MTTRILTLFGEELPPEPPAGAGGKRKNNERKTKEEQQPESRQSAAEPEPLADEPLQKAKTAKKILKKKSPAAARRKKEKPAGKAAQAEAPAILADWQPEKQYYTIGEVSRLFRVNISHIRFWTNEFGLKVRTTRKGDRLYPPEIIQELRMIYHLVKERGFTLNGAKTKLRENKKAELESVSLKQSLQSLRNQLLEIRNQLAGTTEL